MWRAMEANRSHAMCANKFSPKSYGRTQPTHAPHRFRSTPTPTPKKKKTIALSRSLQHPLLPRRPNPATTITAYRRTPPCRTGAHRTAKQRLRLNPSPGPHISLSLKTEATPPITAPSSLRTANQPRLPYEHHRTTNQRHLPLSPGLHVALSFPFLSPPVRNTPPPPSASGPQLPSSRVFEELPCKDVISWNTMITGYAQNGLANEAIEVYDMMKEQGNFTPHQGTWVSILPAYAHLGALRDGMRTHGQVLKVGLDGDVFLATCLIDLYGQCGRLDDALSVFYEVPSASSVPWNAIISCYGLHGHGEACMQLFTDMLDEGVMPDQVTFLSLLTACSHSGLVDQGKWCLDLMQHKYGMKPTLKHYGCMVDMFGRAGQLEVAYSFIESMPLRPDASVWGALRAAWRIHGNVELGKKASDHLFEVDAENIGYCVLMSNLYAKLGR